MEPQKVNAKDSRIYALIVLYDMHTGFFRRAIEGFTSEAAQSRLDTKANHVAWLTGSLVQERFELASAFGTQLQQTNNELFSQHKGIKDDTAYPALNEFQQDWDRISPILREILTGLEPEKLNETFEEEGMKMSYFDYLSFVIYREANIIGQIALWRRLLGYPALKYD